VLSQISAFESQYVSQIADLEKLSTGLGPEGLPAGLLATLQVTFEEPEHEDRAVLSFQDEDDDEEEEDDDEKDDETLDEEPQAENSDVEEEDFELWDTDDEEPQRTRQLKRKLSLTEQHDEGTDEGVEWDDEPVKAPLSPEGFDSALKKRRVDERIERVPSLDGASVSVETSVTQTDSILERNLEAKQKADSVETASIDMTSAEHPAIENTQTEEEKEDGLGLWLRRRMSRNKGRDDVLFTRALLEELVR
jgi:hypothetical protein